MIARQRRARLALALALAAVALLVAAPVSGARSAPAATTVVFGGASAVKTKGAEHVLVLRATLTDASGKGLAKRPIDFYQQVDLMGTRNALVGSGETDTTGMAVINYQPAENGQQTIIARFAGDDTFATSEGRGTIQVSNAQYPFPEAAEPLATPARWLPRFMGLLVAAIWVVLLGVFLTTARGIRRAAHPSSPAA